jgi:hypothetical protein
METKYRISRSKRQKMTFFFSQVEAGRADHRQLRGRFSFKNSAGEDVKAWDTNLVVEPSAQQLALRLRVTKQNFPKQEPSFMVSIIHGLNMLNISVIIYQRF